MLSLGSCSGFLDTKPDTLLTQDQTFGDPTLVKSVLANFYGRVTIGQRIDDWDQWTMLDEVIHFDTNSDCLLYTSSICSEPCIRRGIWFYRQTFDNLSEK